MNVGEVLTLEVVREAPFGHFLSDGNMDVLLHKNDCDVAVEIGQTVEVFLFLDKSGRMAATTKVPTAINDQYDWAEVVAVDDKIGAFVDVGISKDVVVSGDDLPKVRALWPTVGDKLLITLKVDRLNRLFGRLATENVVADIAREAPAEIRNKNFKARAYRLLKVGSFLITEEGYRCFVHESERVAEPRLGELVEGRVIGITEDGELNGSLLPRGYERISDDAAAVFDYLQGRTGKAMPYTDKTSPEEIEKRFGMSKGAFKRALGNLMKAGKIVQEDGWTKIK